MLALKNNTAQIMIFLFLGAIVGLFVSIVLRLPHRWMIVMMMGISLPFIGLIVGDLRRFFILLLILAVPLMIDINFVQKYEYQAGAHTAGISIRDIFVLLILAVWIIEKISNEELRMRFFPSITIPALIYLEICLVTFLWAPRVDLATLEIIQMTKVFILYLILANNLRDVSDVRFVVWALLATVALEGTVAIAQMITGKTLGLSFLGEYPVRLQYGMRYVRAAGTLGHPNKLAMYLEIILPLAAGLFYSSKTQRDRIIAAIIFGVGVTALILTSSRGGWIAFFVSIILFIFIIIKRRMVELKTIIGPSIIMFLIIITLTASFWGAIHKRVTGDDHGSAMGRIPLIQVALRIIQAHPIGGVGLNNYAEIMKEYDNTILGRRFTRLERPVHNTYLLITAETGIIGFMAFAWFMFSVFFAAIKGARMPDPKVSFLGVGLICGLVAFGLHGMVEKHPPGGYPLFYVLMAIAANIGSKQLVVPDETVAAVEDSTLPTSERTL